MKEIAFGILAIAALSGSAALSAPSTTDMSDAGLVFLSGSGGEDPPEEPVLYCWWWERLEIFGPTDEAKVKSTCPGDLYRRADWYLIKNYWRNGRSYMCRSESVTPVECRTFVEKDCPFSTCVDPALFPPGG